jgi:hypothetical protein
MQKCPTRKLIQETKALINLSLFLQNEIGLKEHLSAKELKQLLSALKAKKIKKMVKF